MNTWRIGLSSSLTSCGDFQQGVGCAAEDEAVGALEPLNAAQGCDEILIAFFVLLDGVSNLSDDRLDADPFAVF